MKSAFLIEAALEYADTESGFSGLLAQSNYHFNREPTSCIALIRRGLVVFLMAVIGLTGAQLGRAFFCCIMTQIRIRLGRLSTGVLIKKADALDRRAAALAEQAYQIRRIFVHRKDWIKPRPF